MVWYHPKMVRRTVQTHVAQSATAARKIDIIGQERIRRERVRLAASFRAFVEAAWPVVEPGAQFKGGMHIDAICEHLQACYERRIKKLLINVPPRSGKSTIASVLFPVWVWTNRPEERFLFASYGLNLATGDSVKTRRVIESAWFLERWPEVRLVEDQNLKTHFENVQTGYRKCISVDASTTGHGGSFLILDDPHNVMEAESETVREGAVTWFREAWSTRRNDDNCVMIVIMQRVHQRDVSGYCLEEGGWDHLCLPMEYEGQKVTTSLGWSDPRTEIGQLLWPEQVSPEMVADLKKRMGATATAGQLQQRPVPRGGGTFKKAWLRFWCDPNLPMPPAVSIIDDEGHTVQLPQKKLPALEPNEVHSWDLTFKEGKTMDYVVGQVWVRGSKDRANCYLLAQERGQWDFVATKSAVQRLRNLSQQARPGGIATTLIEEKANGSAIIASLKADVPGIVPVNPQGGKEARAAAVAPLVEGGNVWLPHPSQQPWVEVYIDELRMFPRARHDDQVDATTQALVRMQESRVETIDPAALAPFRGSTGYGALSRDNPFRGI